MFLLEYCFNQVEIEKIDLNTLFTKPGCYIIEVIDIPQKNAVLTLTYSYPMDDVTLENINWEKLRDVMLQRMLNYLRPFILLEQHEELFPFLTFELEIIS